MNYVIGCGGTGSWLARGLAKLVEPFLIRLVDGDTVEEKNLDRQLFSSGDVGKFKSRALATIIGASYSTPEYYSSTSFSYNQDDWLFCCADNHAARREVLLACDRDECQAIIAGNEYTDAEAYSYFPSWKGGYNDPRMVYPSINTDHDGDPTLRDGCSVEVATKPQLAQANMVAAAMMLQLYWFWAFDDDCYKLAVEGNRPIHHLQTKWKLTTIREGDRANERNNV